MRILNLSDLHFGSLADANNWYSQLADDLIHELDCSSLDALIISGDVANKSTADEYTAAEAFLESVCKEFDLGAERLIIVPGNHDVNWSLARKAYEPVRRKECKLPIDENHLIDKGEYVEIQDPDKYKQRFSNFAKFYGRVKGESYPLDYDRQAILYHLPTHNLLILGLNSAWQLDHHYASRTSIHPDALSNALTHIRQTPIYAQCLKFAVWHHPLNSHDRIADIGFMQRLAQAGFCIALHGHIHKADANLYRYDMSPGGRKIEVVGAGTFGAPTHEWVPGYPLQYNLLRLESNELVVETRCRKELSGAWQPDAIWAQGPGLDPLPRYKVTLPEASDTNTNTREIETQGAISATVYTETSILPPVEVEEVEEIERAVIPVKKVLILAVCPLTSSRLRLDAEVREICAVLRRAQKVKYVVEIRWAVRSRDLRQALLEFEPEIVHFCGHGSVEGGILLEDENGEPHPLTPEVLAGLFELFSDSVECLVESVFFNMCHTNSQAKAVLPYVNYVVGTGRAISDRNAIVFSSSFYEALANGRPVEFAYKYACTAVKMAGHPEEFSPTLWKSERPLRSSRRRYSRGFKHSRSALRILFLAASPQNMTPLRLDEEMREIHSVAGEAIRQGRIIIQQRWGARFEDLHQALLEFRPQIVHFTGHGSKDGLLFEDEMGNADTVAKQPLIKLFRLFSNRIECVFLNADFSADMTSELSESIDYVIGARQIGNESTIAFARGFYRTVGANGTIEEAFVAGCAEAQQKSKEDEMYVLRRKTDSFVQEEKA